LLKVSDSPDNSNDRRFPQTTQNQRVKKRSGNGIGCWIAGALAALFVFILLLPDLLRPRVSYNESAAIRDVRAVLSAEAAYAELNGLYYVELECLTEPPNCLPSYPSDAAPFLLEALDETRDGFLRKFVPGLPVGPDAPSASSLESFTFAAYPETPGVSGIRSFCGDSTGQIWVDITGASPIAENGKCKPELTLLE
jgi:hypothetical protein